MFITAKLFFVLGAALSVSATCCHLSGQAQSACIQLESGIFSDINTIIKVNGELLLYCGTKHDKSLTDRSDYKTCMRSLNELQQQNNRLMTATKCGYRVPNCYSNCNQVPKKCNTYSECEKIAHDSICKITGEIGGPC